MISQRTIFLNHVAQTSPFPPAIEVERAEGIYVYAKDGRRYIDLISGIAVSNVGHCHPKVIEAIEKQIRLHSHVMVYGEFIQTPQNDLAQALISLLPKSLESVYFVNSGSEAVEGALKLSKRINGRSEIISCINAYHGSTHGSLSVCGDESLKMAFRPLLPDIRHIRFNEISDLEFITHRTSCVIVEPIQGEAGAVLPTADYLQKLQARCREIGALLVLDEIQTGFGRTGSFFAFEHFNITPDILCLGKAMGGGMPLGAFISSREHMNLLTHNPMLGHITTFGGHPVSCASSLAALNIITQGGLIQSANEKGNMFRSLLKHPSIKAIHGKGLLLALDLGSKELSTNVMLDCMENGLITDWFLFNSNCIRIAPPLTIESNQILESCEIILKSIMKFS